MSLCMLSNLGSATSNVHIQGSAPSVLHLHKEHIIDCEAQRGVDDGNQGAIKCSQKWPTLCLRRKKIGYASIICCSSGQQLFTALENKHVFGHPMKNEHCSIATNDQPLARPVQPFPGMTGHSGAGLNLNGKHLKWLNLLPRRNYPL